MDMPRHNFFANAGFPENQYRNVGIGNLRAQFAHLHHSWIARNDFTSVSDGKPATACLAFLERTLYGSLEVFLPERFDKIIAGAEAHRLDHHVYVPCRKGQWLEQNGGSAPSPQALQGHPRGAS